MSHYLNMKKRILSARKNLREHLEKQAERALQSECTAQNRLSEAQVKMDRQKLGKEKSDSAPSETNEELE